MADNKHNDKTNQNNTTMSAESREKNNKTTLETTLEKGGNGLPSSGLEQGFYKVN